MAATKFKFITFGEHFVVTPIIMAVIEQLEAVFAAENYPVCIVSGLRTDEDQLRIIRDYLVKKGLDKKYPEAMHCKATDQYTWNGQIVYTWQPAWSALLNSGIIINPPIGAICLMDYVNHAGENKKGKFIDASVHFKGTAFDIAGANDGIGPETAIIQKCLGKIKGLVGYVSERGNNCLHCDCKFIG